MLFCSLGPCARCGPASTAAPFGRLGRVRRDVVLVIYFSQVTLTLVSVVTFSASCSVTEIGFLDKQNDNEGFYALFGFVSRIHLKGYVRGAACTTIQVKQLEFRLLTSTSTLWLYLRDWEGDMFLIQIILIWHLARSLI